MRFLDKMERKYGRYAIRNLPAVIVIMYVVGYLLQSFMPQLLGYLLLRPDLILKGQVWRVITWVFMPPSRLDLLTILMLYVYFSFGKALEQTLGSFKFNVFYFTGILLTTVCAFIAYFINPQYMMLESMFNYYSTYHINTTIFLAIAFSYPDMQVLLYFLIPIKMKWIGILDIVMLGMQFVQGGWIDKTSIIAAALNLLILFMMVGRFRRYNPREVHRRQEFKKNVQQMQPKSVTRHKCAICGRSELDGDQLEFRFCSKCEGNYEYCQDHLFTHQHVKRNQV